MDCSIVPCGKPRYVATTGNQWATMCDAHNRMLHVLEGELKGRTGSSVGATPLFRRLVAVSPEQMPTFLRDELARLTGSGHDVEALLSRMEAARRQAA